MLQKLYNRTKPLPEYLRFENKYTFLVYHKVLPAGFIEVSDIFSKSSKLNNYIVDKEQVLIFPNYLNGKIMNLFIRGVNDSQFPLKIGENMIPYGLDYFNKDFKYGDPIILVEGLADYGGLKLLDPTLNIVVMFSNSLPKSQYELIAGLTNNIIVLTDNDEAGLVGYRTIKKSFKKYPVNVIRVEQFSSLKDTGDIVDLIMNDLKFNSGQKSQQLIVISQYYLANLK